MGDQDGEVVAVEFAGGNLGQDQPEARAASLSNKGVESRGRFLSSHSLSSHSSECLDDSEVF